MIDVAAIRRNPDQPRKVFDSAALDELRASIERHGVLQPIQVRRDGSGFEIISGERRWRAARSAGHSEIPAVVRDDVDDGFSLELAIVENVQRQDLDPLEKARGYRALMERVGLTQEQVAGRLGVSRSAVANHLRLLDLPDPALEAIAEGLITMGHAKALLSGKSQKAILAALGDVVRKGLSVRETESLLQARGAASGAKSAAVSQDSLEPVAPWVGELESRLREALGAKVTLRNGPRYRGSITIEYAGREDLERLVETLAPKEQL